MGLKMIGGFFMNITDEKRICLLDLNYTLVSNQQTTKMLRPFSRRMQAEEYRRKLIDAIKDDYVIIVTARPDYQKKQTMDNIFKKTGWLPAEAYFNDINAEPPALKESVLRRFIFPKFGLPKIGKSNHGLYYAVESNPKTRIMYAKYGIEAQPYDKFLKDFVLAKAEREELSQMTLFN